MSTTATRWSQRQAAEAAGTTRAAVLAAAADGLIRSGDLELGDVLVLRAVTAVRNVLFPGEAQPANSTRTLRPRLQRLAEVCHQVARTNAPGIGQAAHVTALLGPDDVTLAHDQGQLVTAALDAQRAGVMVVVLPLGSWLSDLDSRSRP